MGKAVLYYLACVSAAVGIQLSFTRLGLVAGVVGGMLAYFLVVLGFFVGLGERRRTAGRRLSPSGRPGAPAPRSTRARP
jgi:hypothetical protein